MKLARILFIAAAVALGACSGNFATGTGMPQTAGIPPVNPSYPPNGSNGMPQSQTASSPQPTPAPGSYPISQAQSGFACPATTEGYACLLKFNLPAPTPTPKPGTRTKQSIASPSPSPTPTPTPTPTATPGSEDDMADDSPPPAGSATPAPTPTPPSVSLKAEAMPKGAPGMVHTPANSLDVVPLMMVTLTSNGPFPLDGYALAQFTLPKEQLVQRGFALQLFQEGSSHRKTTYTPIWTFDKSVLAGTTLTFNFQVSSLTLAKGSTYALVLYGDDMSKQTASPAPTGSPSGAPASTAPASSALPSSAPASGAPASAAPSPQPT